MTDDKTVAAAFHNGPCSVISTRIDHPFADYAEADAEFPKRDEFKKFQALLSRLENIENETREANNQPIISYGANTVYDTPVFDFTPTAKGIYVYMRHWGPAPTYPAAGNLKDLLRSPQMFHCRSSVAQTYGACYGEETLRLSKDSKHYKKILKVFKDSPALLVIENVLYLRYFSIPQSYPIARTPSEIDLKKLSYARTEAEAASLGGHGVKLVAEYMPKTWKRQSTVVKNHGHYHKHPWAGIVNFADNSFGTEIRYWKIDQSTTGLTPAERSELQERATQRLTTTVKQETRLFGLFSEMSPSQTSYDDIVEEGSGRKMGL